MNIGWERVTSKVQIKWIEEQKESENKTLQSRPIEETNDVGIWSVGCGEFVSSKITEIKFIAQNTYDQSDTTFCIKPMSKDAYRLGCTNEKFETGNQKQ